MADKYHSDTQEKIETIAYAPYLPTTGDKEPGTHTIVPTARPAIAGAQYSHSLTLSKPSDARLVVKRIASRLNVNIAGLGTATHVYCSVRVDVDDVDHELFSEDWTSVGNKLDAVDTHAANRATIFNLFKDGAAHTFYFLFWADVASQATIDLVQLWEAVGSCSSSDFQEALRINHSGFASMYCGAFKIGTGNLNVRIVFPETTYYIYAATSEFGLVSVLLNNHAIAFSGSVATDLYYLYRISLTFLNWGRIAGSNLREIKEG